MSTTKSLLPEALEVARLTLAFGRVKRITMHEDGITPETDTDHTVMLGVMACALAARFQPDLDLGLVAQFAYAHDLVEAKAGDTPTATPLSEMEKRAKAEREQDAYRDIARTFEDSLPWIPAMIARYEALADPEARFIKALDKVMPKLTHILNECAVLIGPAPHPYDFYHNEQRVLMATLTEGQSWLMQLWEESVAEVRRIALEANEQTPLERFQSRNGMSAQS